MKNKRFQAVLALGAAASCIVPVLAYAQFGRIHVAVNRHEFHGRCPVEVLFTGTINLEPHPHGLVFNYHWERSDGAKSRVEVVHPGPNQRSIVVREPWRIGGGHHEISATLHVNSGNTHVTESSPVVRVECR
jgi:hypothetical protein